MDAVITYVNGLDPVWQKDYEKHTNIPALEKRFRDWGTLKYLLRGIEKYMPFIRNVYLVVSHESQVPEWTDCNNLHIVLHKDIIPAEYLPTFNSTAIEMFLHRIEGLDEEFLYFNDDMFPVDTCKPEDFFREGKGVIGMKKHILATGMYKKQCNNSSNFARKALGFSSSYIFLRPQHICSPMLKSLCDELYDNYENEIKKTVTRLREEKNLNQYLYLDYMFYKGRIINENIPKKHFSLAIASAKQIRTFLQNPSRKMVCINDVHLSEQKYEELRTAIIEAFENHFPGLSRFEKA